GMSSLIFGRLSRALALCRRFPKSWRGAWIPRLPRQSFPFVNDCGTNKTMTEGNASRNRRRRAPRPLDRAGLQDLALAYVARFATSAAKLERYLVRKLRERGWEGEGAADPEAVVRRFAELGYVDDAAYARSRSGSLLRRGYGPRRVNQALAEAGIDEETRGAVRAGEAEERRAALAMARKRGFGPFGT